SPTIHRTGGRTMDETAGATTTGVAQVFDLHALKAFASDKRVRKMLFKTEQLWSEIACYEPGQSTVMHTHPREEEAIYVLEGTAGQGLAREFGLSQAEYEAVRDKDPRRMMDLGVHQYYVPQILRLFFGAAHNSNASAALECYQRAYPEETAKAMALQARLERAR